MLKMLVTFDFDFLSVFSSSSLLVTFLWIGPPVVHVTSSYIRFFIKGLKSKFLSLSTDSLFSCTKLTVPWIDLIIFICLYSFFWNVFLSEFLLSSGPSETSPLLQCIFWHLLVSLQKSFFVDLKIFWKYLYFFLYHLILYYLFISVSSTKIWTLWGYWSNIFFF